MRHWTILLIVSILVGCASNPVELPDWELAAREPVEVSDPLILPDLCAIPLDGVWPIECWKALDAYDIAASANYEIALANADALRKSDASYDALIEAGKLQQQLAVIRQEMLEQERQAHTRDNWFYRIVIVLGLIGIGVAQ